VGHFASLTFQWNDQRYKQIRSTLDQEVARERARQKTILADTGSLDVKKVYPIR
jgi:hypothetical protein